jgi:glutaredoxin 3
MTIEIYTTPVCGYCRLAKAHLERLGLQFQEIDIARQPERAAEMVARSGRRTVPQIFVDDRPVGGYDDLVRLDPASLGAAGVSAARASQQSGEFE